MARNGRRVIDMHGHAQIKAADDLIQKVFSPDSRNQLAGFRCKMAFKETAAFVFCKRPESLRVFPILRCNHAGN